MRFRAEWLLIVFVSLTLSACDGDPIEPAGQNDYATLVSLGNSLTAGYINGALLEGGQMASYPNLLSWAISGRDLAMPIVCDCPGNRGFGLPSAGAPVPGMMYVDPVKGVTQDPLTVHPLSLLKNLTHALPYENLGIPFAFTWDVLNATSADSSFGGIFAGRPNLFVDPILRDGVLGGEATTMVEQAAQLAAADYATPQVISLWVGNNDILLGATTGEPVLGVTVTSPEDFGALFAGIEAHVKAMSFPQVVIGTIPSIGSIPFVTTINPIAAINDGTPIFWNTEETDVVRILLSAKSLISTATGPNPDYLPGGDKEIPANLTLDEGEVAVLDQAVEAYNAIIEGITSANGWALADLNAAMAAMPSNVLDPATFAEVNAAYPLLPAPIGRNVNSAFSLDGAHPSEKGQAVVARTFVNALNETYGTTYTPPDPDAITNVLGFELLDAGEAPKDWQLSRQAAETMMNMFGGSPRVLAID